MFGPEFDQNRLTLREHCDYMKLYGSRPPRFEPGSHAPSTRHATPKFCCAGDKWCPSDAPPGVDWSGVPPWLHRRGLDGSPP
jgi:hypothetical protein